ncbi:MAG: MoxR family ATPase, partial [Myxococcales bacterium]|nr:MoxR family ATPase [Myxococcales bacterium]
FEFRRGPVFANLLLADEINRTTPRTQSSLLEAMAEGRVTIDEATHDLPSPFHVIATQNPLEAHGTYPLPESQLDRFLMRLSIGYPDKAVERDLLLSRRREEPVESLEAVIDTEALVELQQKADEVHVDETLADYVMDIISATRESPRLAVGVSPRGALALLRACRALALVRGRDFVIPEDIKDLTIPVLAHRVSVGGNVVTAGDSRRASEEIVQELVDEVPSPV